MDSSDRGFSDLDYFLELPRLTGLALSPDGTRLVTSVAALGSKRTSYVSSLWEVSTDPQGPASRRLTWGSESESGAPFRPYGSLLFISARPDPNDDDDERPASLWLLPAGAGEACPFATRPGGISAAVVARDSGSVVLSSPTMPSSTSTGEDERRHKARKELKVGATLHDSLPIRWWDTFYGPAAHRLLVVENQVAEGKDENSASLRDLTGHTGTALKPEPDFAITPDGSTVISAWNVIDAGGEVRSILVAVDVATGVRRTLLDDPRIEFGGPVVSADGSKVAVVAQYQPTPDEPANQKLKVLHLDTGEVHDVAPAWDRWPAGAPVWTPDGAALLVAADDQGHSPVFRIDLNDHNDHVVRKLTDRGTFTQLVLARDGSAAYALRSGFDEPPTPVRIDPVTGEVTPLRGPAATPPLPGTLTEVQATADDGSPLRAWLVLPEGAGPEQAAPLLLWIHGGPMTSWNIWSWRWNPWLAAARGYAVLLPDPALSTGYGLDFIRRGWPGWGGASYTDLMAITDVTTARPDIDATRTAAMGASFGGYMANWIAGHTDRFRGIVSHAGIWNLEEFRLATDAAYYWRQTMNPQMRADNSPSAHAAAITTPMLIIHGEKDYRVPIGEALAMYTQLGELNQTDDGVMPHRLLVFPDENHWVTKPQNARVWYETVFAFLGQTVHGADWKAPDLLR